jgi:fatty acid synthase subunit beta
MQWGTQVATRGVMLWKELDEKIFALPLKEQAAAIQKNKAWIIERLNRDSMKVSAVLRVD